MTRELDLEIAEKVMGWRIEKEHSYSLPNGFEVFDDNGYSRGWFLDRDVLLEGGTIPHYSTDIAAAWEIVEKFDNGEAHWEVCKVVGGYMAVCVWSGEPYGRGVADAAPEAICLAALAAVERGEKDE